MRLFWKCVLRTGIFTWFVAMTATAQNRTIDSLTTLLTPAVQDTSHVNLLNALSKEYRSVSGEKALSYAEEALQLAQKLRFRRGEAAGYNNQGVVWRQRGEYEKALRLHHQALSIRQELGDDDLIGASYNNIGTVYYAREEYYQALEYFLKALGIAERKGDSSKMAIYFNNIGEIYRYQGDYDKAFAYHRKGLAICESAGDKSSMAQSLNNVGEIYRQQGILNKALGYFLRSLSLMQALGETDGSALELNNIGDVYYRQREYASALEFHRKALSIQQTSNNKRGVAVSLISLGAIYMALGILDSAGLHLQHGLQASAAIGAKELQLRAYAELARVDSAQGNFAAAFEHQKRFLVLNDSIVNVQKAHQINDLQHRYDDEKRDQHIALLESEKSSQIILRNVLMIGFIVVCAAGAFVTNGYVLNRRKNADLRVANGEILRQKDILEEQASEIELKNGELQQANIQLEEAYAEVQMLNNELVEKNYSLEQLNMEMVRQQMLLEDQAVEIELANGALQEKNVQLERLDEEKNEFLGIAAHDLKNPLTSIIMASSTVQRYYERMSQSDILSAMQMIEETAQMMNEIVINILDTNAIESGSLNLMLENFDAVPLVTSVVEKYAQRAHEKSIALQFIPPQTPVMVYADKALTVQVLENLVSNALKYSPKERTVWVEIMGNSQFSILNSQPPMRFRVKDEGPGLSVEDQMKLFGKFTRLSAQPTGGEHSTGLGLSIVKKLTEAMNGHVWCESTFGHGATFYVELPTIPSVQRQIT